MANAETKVEMNTQMNVETQTIIQQTKTEKTLTTYDEMLIKKEIAPYLSLDPLGPWELVSEQGDLVMIHYNTEADPVTYGNLRGVVFDRNKKVVVSCSYPHAFRAVTSELKVANDQLQVTDNLTLPLESTRIKIGFRSPLITFSSTTESFIMLLANDLMENDLDGELVRLSENYSRN